MATEQSNCFICDNPLVGSSVTQVKEKGLETFRQSSIKRKDGKKDRLKGLTSIEVHEACRKAYNNEKLIAAFLRRGGVDATPPRRRSVVPTFRFKDNCFLCGADVTEQLKKLQKLGPRERSRKMVYNVRKISMKDTIIQLAKVRNDDWGRSIVERLEQVHDLVAADGLYHIACMKKLYHAPSSGETDRKRGPHASEIDTAMQYIYSYLEANSEECQFSLDDLIDKIEGDYRPHVKTVKAQLLKKYGDDIIISCSDNKSSVVCFRDTGYKILTNSWYDKKSSNEEEERMRIVKTAAAIIVEDIRSMVCETTHYPPSDNFLQGVSSDIPETLRVLLDGVILKNKRSSLEKWKTKSIALAHCVIAAARPKSFLSPMQIGVAAFLYQKYGSRRLIDTLSSLGYCSSYTEAMHFQVSAIMQPSLGIDDCAFSQFVFDNADFNTRTIDGYNTFHAMGGIQCITPTTAIAPDQKIKRLNEIPSAITIGKFGNIQFKTFEKKMLLGLEAIEIRNLDSIRFVSNVILPSAPDLLWLYGKWADLCNIPGWSGFMEQATADLPFHKSFVACLPFVNAPPGNYDTVYSVLCSAAEKCELLNQQTCFVTFDQPLYIKAREIISTSSDDTKLSHVVVRLGGFHLLMSFMGSIGYIMAGSGLKELFNTIYALNSIEKIMAGHAYARAVRAHMLTHLAIAKIIIQSIDFTPAERQELEDILYNLDRTVVLEADQEECYKQLARKFEEQLVKFEQRGATAKLWVEYFRMVTLVKQFIEAERTGNWNLHLDTIHKMLPYFHASGHFLYAKSSHLYLQDMYSLKQKMTNDEYESFTTKGWFTIRRSDKFWCGTWSDMTIEQSLMRTMKCLGGLTHGRGVKDSVLTKWTLGMVFLHNVCEGIEQFCNIAFASSEQHVDLRGSRISRDNNDVEKLMDWFTQHFPFPETQQIMSISTGMSGTEKINPHMAQELGRAGISKIIGGNFNTVKFKRNDRVNPLGVMNASIRIEEEVVTIDPLAIFQRMCITKKSDEELRNFLTFELAPFPLSLFTEQGIMRKCAKSALYNAFKQCPIDITFGSAMYVIDGGYLLHRVVWNRGESFSSICNNYVAFVQSNYTSNAIIVFDGYPENAEDRGTKYAERLRRSRIHTSVDIFFNETMIPSVAQEKFLANDRNKSRLIEMLKLKFEAANFTVKQATEDADVLIVTTANSVSSAFDSAIVVGEDTDLLILLIALSTRPNTYLLKPGRGKTAQRIYSTSSIDKSTADNLLFLHAFSGCDTTSALFNQGKIKYMTAMKNNSRLAKLVDVFKNPDADPETIAEVGEQFLVTAVYGYSGKKPISLNDYRYQCFKKSAYKNKFNIASLPPTEAAARQHSFRTYHQVQQWCGVEKNAEEWGWKKNINGLIPVTTTQPPAPQTLLKLISCKCKKGCRGACGCRKVGLKCSTMCINCYETCSNVETRVQDSDDENEMENILNKFQDEIEVEADCVPQISEASPTMDIEEPAEPGPSGTAKRRRMR